MPEQLGITVVLPTLSRGDCLRTCVEDLFAQNYAPLEILIVDQSVDPDEQMVLLAGELEILSYHHVSFQSLPKARNYAWRHAKYDAILFLDDDIRCHPGLLSEHARSLQEPGVGVVGGRVDEVPASRQLQSQRGRTGSFSRTTAVPLRGWSVEGEFEVDHAPGGNFSTWRRVLESCGGIDETLSIGAALYEETDFCLRAKRNGYRILFNGSARITHLALPRGGCRVQARDKYVYGLAHNRAVLIGRHLDWFNRPFAVARLLVTGLSFAARERSPMVLGAWISGVRSGFRHVKSVSSGVRA